MCSRSLLSLARRYFRFTGRFLGKALFDGQVVASHMIRHIYKHLLGWPLMFADIEMIDDTVYRSLLMLQDIDDVEDLCLDFSVMESAMGEQRSVELVEGGSDMEVTNDNVKLFLEKSLEYRQVVACISPPPCNPASPQTNTLFALARVG